MKRILMNLAAVMLLPLLMAATCGQNNKKEMKTLVAYFFATSGGSDVSGADKQFHAQYPDINWKAGKLLNNASKKTLQDWVTSNR